MSKQGERDSMIIDHFMLGKATYVQRYEDHPCDCCGQKHDASTRTCDRCKAIREPELTLHNSW